MKTSEELEVIEVEPSIETIQELEEWTQRESIIVDKLVCKIIEEKLDEL